MRQFREGDIVRVDALVTYCTLDGFVTISVGGATAYLDPEQLEMIRPKLDPGEVVLLGEDEVTVIANHESNCWIEHPINGQNIVLLKDLKRQEKDGGAS